MSRPMYTVKKCRKKEEKECFELRKRGGRIAMLKPVPEHNRFIISMSENNGISNIALVSEKQFKLFANETAGEPRGIIDGIRGWSGAILKRFSGK